MSSEELKISRRKAIIECGTLMGSLTTLFFSPELREKSFRDTKDKQQESSSERKFVENQGHNNISDRLYGIRSDLSSTSKVARTFGLSAVSIAGQVAADLIFEHLGIRNGQQGHQEVEKVISNPTNILFISLVRPLQEEFFFRALPSLLTDVSLDNAWLTSGVPSSLVFAAGHNLTRYKPEKGWEVSDGIYYSLDTVPVSQLIAGLTFWYIQRQYGFEYAALSHILQNTSICGLVSIAYHFDKTSD